MRILSFLASLLIIPLVLLLFAQWPLREWVQAYSRQANDFGQIVFALYVAVAITSASLVGVHLAAGANNHAQKQLKTGFWRTFALFICLAPWALFMLWASFATVRESVLGFERFADALTPGFFMVKLALVLLLFLVFWDAVCGVIRTFRKKP